VGLRSWTCISPWWPWFVQISGGGGKGGDGWRRGGESPWPLAISLGNAPDQLT
jgi:hypothetical protein